MNDRELLCLAALAHGGLVYIDGLGWIFEDENGNRGAWWNPLTDDGDALRLAVDLNITIDPGYGTHGIYVWQSAHKEKTGAFSFELINDVASTRRAIVRAAAEMAKGAA